VLPSSEWHTYDAAEKARRIAAFNAGEPGFRLSACNCLADNMPEFLFVWSPLKMKGATGSPGNPLAIH